MRSPEPAPDGFERGGPDGACEQLQNFWHRVSLEYSPIAVADEMFDAALKFWNVPRLEGYGPMEAMIRLMSPYVTNPLNINPIRDILEELIDFEAVRHSEAIALHVSATNVRTGGLEVFSGDRIDAGTLMASACVPFLFQAVEIDGEAYWDGGFSGNPSLSPLLRRDAEQDFIIVQVNPATRGKIPTNPQEIANRLAEINFNSAYLLEVRAINLVNAIMDEAGVDNSRYGAKRLHRIEPTDDMSDCVDSSRVDVSWPFFCELRDIGSETARNWLDANYRHLGARATFDPASGLHGTGGRDLEHAKHITGEARSTPKKARSA